MIIVAALILGIAIILGAIILGLAIGDTKDNGTTPASKAPSGSKQMAEIIKRENPVEEFLKKKDDN